MGSALRRGSSQDRVTEGPVHHAEGSGLPSGIGGLFRESEHEVIIFEFTKLILAVL